MDNNNELEQSIVEASSKAIENFGAAEDVFHHEYGWILRDSQITEEGREFFKKYYGVKDKKIRND